MSNELDTKGKMIDQITKPLLNGVMTYVGAKALGMKYDINLPIVNRSYEAPMALAMAAVPASFVTEIAHNFVLPGINQHSKMGQMEAMILSPALQGGLLAGIVQTGGSVQLGNLGTGKVFGLGAASEIASTYAFESILRPFLHTKV
jgi:hypothetical protein